MDMSAAITRKHHKCYIRNSHFLITPRVSCPLPSRNSICFTFFQFSSQQIKIMIIFWTDEIRRTNGMPACRNPHRFEESEMKPKVSTGVLISRLFRLRVKSRYERGFWLDWGPWFCYQAGQTPRQIPWLMPPTFHQSPREHDFTSFSSLEIHRQWIYQRP